MPTLNYSLLVSTVQSYSENTDSEFSGEINNFVEHAELRMTRDLDSYGTVFWAQTTLIPSDPFVTKPSTALVVKSLNITDGGNRYQLLLRTNEWVYAYWPDRTSTGRPKYWANWGRANVLIAPAPASANLAELEYVARPAVLSTGATTNFFTDYCWNALFYATMVEAMMFQKDYQSAAQWEARYQQEVNILNNESRRTRRDDQQVPMNPDGGENTLKEGQK